MAKVGEVSLGVQATELWAEVTPQGVTLFKTDLSRNSKSELQPSKTATWVL